MNEELNSEYDEKDVYSHVFFLLTKQQKLTGNSVKYWIFKYDDIVLFWDTTFLRKKSNCIVFQID